MDDPYSILGVPRDASPEEIKNAYRRLAKKYHPDLHPNDPIAARKMNEVNMAYEQIKNPSQYKSSNSHSSYGNPYGQNPYGQNPYGNPYGTDYQQGQSWEDIFNEYQRQYQQQRQQQQGQKGPQAPRFGRLIFLFLAIYLFFSIFSRGCMRRTYYNAYRYPYSYYYSSPYYGNPQQNNPNSSNAANQPYGSQAH